MKNFIPSSVHTMRPVAKVGIVAGGYLVAGVVASLLVAAYIAATAGPDRQTSSGMYAFGDSLVFLAAFSLAAVPATAAALYFLRTRPGFWLGLSAISLAIASTAVVAGLSYRLSYGLQAGVDPGTHLNPWLELAPIRILIAPAFALFFLLSAVIAPNRPTRIALLIATGAEVAAFGYIVQMWIRSTA